MRRAFLIALLFVQSIAFAQIRPGYRELFENEPIANMRTDVSYFSSAMLEGRKAGSEGETMAAEYFAKRLQEADVMLLSPSGGELFGLKQENGDTLRSHNVLGFINGYDPDMKDHYIVIGARLDNLGQHSYTVNGETVTKTFYGANGNGSGLAVLLQLARMLQENSMMLRRPVIIAAFGASLEANAGSWYFLNRSFNDVKGIDAMINLDMLGTASSGFYAYTASNEDMNAILMRQSAQLQPIKPTLVSNEPVCSDHRSFYASQIPSVFFTTGMYREYNSEYDTSSVVEYDNLERICEYLYNFTIDLASGDKPAFMRQPKPEPQIPGTVSYNDCDVKPSFLGSRDPKLFLQKWVYVYLRYPQSAVNEGVQGKVLVDFVVDEKGKVRDVSVAKGVDPRLDDEAVRVISASPDWKPGRLGGKKVRTAMSIYVEFKLIKK